jgi:hypothetical protein
MMWHKKIILTIDTDADALISLFPLELGRDFRQHKYTPTFNQAKSGNNNIPKLKQTTPTTT